MTVPGADAIDPLITAGPGCVDALRAALTGARSAAVADRSVLGRLHAIRSALAALEAPFVRSDALDLECHRIEMIALVSTAMRAAEAGGGDLHRLLAGRPAELFDRAGMAELAQAMRKVTSAEQEDDWRMRRPMHWRIEGTVFHGGLDLSGLHIGQPLVFVACDFRGPVIFSDSDVGAPVIFEDCAMGDGLLCDRLDIVTGSLDLRGCAVAAVLSATNVRGALHLPRLHPAVCDFTGSVLTSSIEWEKLLIPESRFDRVVFDPPSGETAYFGLATFVGPCSFDGADLRRCRFPDARFGRASFRRALIGALSDLSEATFLQGVSFDDAHIGTRRPPMDVRLTIGGSLSARSLTADGPFRLHLTTQRDALADFAGARFGADAAFAFAGASESRLDLSGAIFAGPVEVRGLPASAVTMTGAQFRDQLRIVEGPAG